MHRMGTPRARPIAAALALGGMALASPGAGALEPFVNLGFTSFVDGFPDPTEKGLAFVQYLRFATSGSLKDGDGDDAAGFVDPRLNALVSVTQLLYTFPRPGSWIGTPALSVLVPVVLLDAQFGAGGGSLQDNGLGVGDIFVGPVFQFAPVVVGQRPVLFHRLEFDVMVPVGRYDPAKQINQGNHAWALNPFWAGTLLAGRHVEVSWRLHWLYNFENTDPIRPPPGVPVPATTQAGQAFHANLAASVEVVPKALRIGVSSYLLRQVTDNRADGRTVPGQQEQVVGVGPGLVWFPSKTDLVFFNAYLETAVRNRFQSHSVQLRWGHAFEGF